MSTSHPNDNFEAEAEIAPQAAVAKPAAVGASSEGLVSRLSSNPAFRSRLVFLGGAGLVLALVSYNAFFRTSTNVALPSDASGVALSSAPTPEMIETGAPSPMASSPIYQEMSKDIDERRAAQAEKEGTTSLPSTETMAANFKPLPEAAASQPSTPGTAPMSPADQAMAAEAARRQQAELQAEVASLVRFMNERRDVWAPAKSDDIIRFGTAKMVNVADTSPVSPAAASAFSQGQAQGGDAQPSAKSQVVLLPAGSQVAAVTATTCNTDFNAPIFAEVATGPIKGAKLVGTCTRANDEALITFNSIAIPGRGVIGTQAVAYNASTNEAGVGTSVDRKLMSKYFLRPLAQGIAAVGEAAKSSGSTTVVVNGATTTTNGQLDNKRARQILGGAVAEQASKDLTAGDIEPTVRVAARHVLSVYFVTDVVAPNN